MNPFLTLHLLLVGKVLTAGWRGNITGPSSSKSVHSLKLSLGCWQSFVSQLMLLSSHHWASRQHLRLLSCCHQPVIPTPQSSKLQEGKASQRCAGSWITGLTWKTQGHISSGTGRVSGWKNDLLVATQSVTGQISQNPDCWVNRRLKVWTREQNDYVSCYFPVLTLLQWAELLGRYPNAPSVSMNTVS